MLRQLLIACVLSAGATLAPAGKVVAAEPIHGHYHVEYRQPNWRERTFGSVHEAQAFADLKRSRSFQVRLERHGHHWHVEYRQLHWQRYRTVGHHREAHELERLLESRGFDARVVHH